MQAPLVSRAVLSLFLGMAFLSASCTGNDPIDALSSDQEETGEEFTLELTEPDRIYFGGGVVQVKPGSLDAKVAYQAEVNGVEASAFELDGTVWVLLPDVETGDHTLSLRNETGIWKGPIQIQQPEVPADPRGFLTSTITESQAFVDELLATASDADRPQWEALKDRLQKGLQGIVSLSDDEIRAIVLFLVANSQETPGGAPFQPAEWDGEKCDRAQKDYVIKVSNAVYSVGSWAASIGAKITGLVSQAGKEYLISVQTALTLRKVDTAGDTLDRLMEDCVQQAIDLILENPQGASPMVAPARAPMLDWGNNDSQTFFLPGHGHWFTAQYTVSQPAFLESVVQITESLRNSLKAMGASFSAALGSALPAGILEPLNQPLDVPSAPTTLELTHVSDARIVGRIEPDGEALFLLFFSFVDGVIPLEKVEFTFTIAGASPYDPTRTAETSYTAYLGGLFDYSVWESGSGEESYSLSFVDRNLRYSVMDNILTVGGQEYQAEGPFSFDANLLNVSWEREYHETYEEVCDDAEVCMAEPVIEIQCESGNCGSAQFSYEFSASTKQLIFEGRTYTRTEPQAE